MNDVGIFRLVDPPAGAVEALTAARAAIDFPWQRLYPLLSLDPDRAVIVKFDPEMAQGATGLYYSRRVEIVLGTRYASWMDGVAFVFAHEVGHLVDNLTLDDATRADLLSHFLAEEAGPWDGQGDPNEPGSPHPWAHEAPHECRWRYDLNPYTHRVNEAFADAFVEAFAPTLTRGRRFSHASNRPEVIRSLTLRPEVPTMAVILTRLAGASRYATAVGASELAFPNGAPEVWIVSGDSFPDALGAGPAAANVGAPVLLVPGTAGATLPVEVAAELRRLNPLRVVIVGGTAAVPESMASQVQKALA